MAALQCEICGGKLIGKPGGVFECDSCGMEYSTEWAKAKIQEIKGTVKVEGTVQVAGSVTVEGSANKESLMKRGLLALKDGNWDNAKEYFDKVLDIDPECAEAYLGKCCARYRWCDASQIETMSHNSYLELTDYKNAKRFASAELVSMLEKYETAAVANQNAKKKKEEERIEAEAIRLAPLRERIRPARNLIAAGDDFVLGVKTDGTVLAAGNDRYSIKTENGYKEKNGKINVGGWRDIVAVAAGREHSVGLKEDGTVVATGRNEELQCEVSSWKNIRQIEAGEYFTVGLQKDGYIIFSGRDEDGDGETLRNSELLDKKIWYDVERIFVMDSEIAGIRADGALLSKNGKEQKEEYSARAVAEVCGSRKYLYASGDYDYGYRVVEMPILSCFENKYHPFCIYENGTCKLGNRDWDNMKMNKWTNLVSIAVGGYYFCVGLKEDGTLVTVRSRYHIIHGMTDYGECNLDHWRLFNSIDTLEEERKKFRRQKVKRIEEERRKEEEERRKEKERGERIDAMLREGKELRNRRNNLGVLALKEKKELDRQIKELNEKVGRLLTGEELL